MDQKAQKDKDTKVFESNSSSRDESVARSLSSKSAWGYCYGCGMLLLKIIYFLVSWREFLSVYLPLCDFSGVFDTGFNYCSGETHDIIKCSCGLRCCAYLGRTLYFSGVDRERHVIYPIHSGCQPIFFIHDAALRPARTASTGHLYGFIQTVLYTGQAVCVCVLSSLHRQTAIEPFPLHYRLSVSAAQGLRWLQFHTSMWQTYAGASNKREHSYAELISSWNCSLHIEMYSNVVE